MKLTVLGSCGSYPGPGRACSGYLVEAGGSVIWIDAGSGTLANLQRHTDPAGVAAVVLTHEHPDHWVDITGYHVAAKYDLRLDRVPIYAPASVKRRVGKAGAPFEWNDVANGDSVEVGDFRLSFSRTDHPVETLAVRVEGGDARLGYSADSGPGWRLSELGGDLDVALCEATWLEEREGSGHMSAVQAAESAREAGARRLILTHLHPRTDPTRARAAAASAFEGPIDVAEDGDVFEVGG